MQRRSFLKNSIGALFALAIEHNKIISELVRNIPKKSMDVLLYAAQTKWGDWKIKATKWTNIDKEKFNNTEFRIESFTPIGIFDNTEIKEKQTYYAKKYNAVNSLHSVDHYQCTINGTQYCVVKQATFKSRSKGGKTRARQNKMSGYWNEMTKKYSSENGKKNIKHTKTKYALLAQKNSATWTFQQCNLDGKVIKTFRGKKSFQNTQFNYNTVRKVCNTNKTYKNCLWKIKNKTNKKHRKSLLTKDRITILAKECSYKAQFKKKYQQAYDMAKRLGIFEKITKHMKRPPVWNKK